MKTNLSTSELKLQIGKFNITIITTEVVKDERVLVFRNNHCSVSTLSKMLKDKFDLEVKEDTRREDYYSVTY